MWGVSVWCFGPMLVLPLILRVHVWLQAARRRRCASRAPPEHSTSLQVGVGGCAGARGRQQDIWCVVPAWSGAISSDVRAWLDEADG